MREGVPQNCGNLRAGRAALLDEDTAFHQAAEVADQVIADAAARCGSIGRAVSVVSRAYHIKPAWLQRLRERRKVPVYHNYYNNLLVALEDAVARQEAAIALNKARLGALSNANSAAHRPLVSERGRIAAAAGGSPAAGKGINS
jgi:hypothetical protein